MSFSEFEEVEMGGVIARGVRTDASVGSCRCIWGRRVLRDDGHFKSSDKRKKEKEIPDLDEEIEDHAKYCALSRLANYVLE